MCDVQCDVESDVHAEAGDLQVIFHDDDETPVQFVIELLHSVFKKQLADAIRLTEAVDQDGQAICGTYPRDVANQVLEAARRRVRASGHPLRITSEAVAEGGETLDGRCKLCGAFSSENRVSLKGKLTLVCDDRMLEITQAARCDAQQAIRLCLRRVGLAFRRHSARSVGRDLAAIPGSYARGRSSGHRQAVLHADPVFRPPRGAPLRDIVHRDTDQRWPCLPAPMARSSCNAVSPSWRAPSTPRVPIAARSCRSMAIAIIEGAREALRSTNCPRFNATK